jgi:membrane protein implicated in regulation of membrane protease activity
VKKAISFAVLWLAIFAAGAVGDTYLLHDTPLHIFALQLIGCVAVMIAALIVGRLWEDSDETFN